MTTMKMNHNLTRKWVAAVVTLSFASIGFAAENLPSVPWDTFADTWVATD